MNALLFRSFLLVICIFTLACERKNKGIMELNIHVPDIKLQVDPQKMEDAFSMMIALQLHRGLLRYDQNGDVMADLADSWTESKDRKEYVFKLRSATFSDDKPITARHVQMSLARLFYLGSSIAADIDNIEGVEDFKKSWDISKFGVQAINDQEVKITLRHPSALFLKQLAVVDCSILPITNFKEEFLISSKTAFSGPYKISANEGMSFELQKWRKDQLDSKNPPEIIRFFVTKESALTLAKEGKTDSLDTDQVGAEDIQKLKKSGWTSRLTELTYEWFVILNPKYIPDQVRAELSQKLDPNDLVKTLNIQNLISAFGLIPKGFYGYIENSKPTHKVATEYKGKKVSFKLDYLANSDFDKKLALYLKEKWDSKNVEVVLNEVPRGEKLARMFGKTAEATIGRKGTDYPDGFSVLTYFKGKYDANYFHVNDPKIDQMIADSSQEFDQTKRAKMYEKIQIEILKHHTNLPLFFGSLASGLWSNKIETIPSHPMGFHTMPFETILMRSE